MPDYVIDSKSLALFKKLQPKQMISFYVAANATGTSVGMVCGKAKNAKQDTTKTKGKALLERLKANKFCRGLIVQEASGETKVVNVGGPISNGLLKKLLKLLAEKAGGDQKARLKSAAENIVGKSFLDELKTRQEMRLDDPSDGDDDNSESAPETFSDALSALAADFLNPRDIFEEEMALTAQARQAYRDARDSNQGLSEATIFLAGCLDSGSDIFDNAEDAGLLAQVFDTIMMEKFVDPSVTVIAQFADDFSRKPTKGYTQKTFRLLDTAMSVYVVQNFDFSDRGAPAIQLDDSTLVAELSAVNLPGWCLELAQEVRNRLGAAQQHYTSSSKSIGMKNALEDYTQALAEIRDWSIAQVEALQSEHLSGHVAISEETLKQIQTKAQMLMHAFNQITIEKNAAHRYTDGISEPMTDLPPDQDDSWSQQDMDFLEEMRQIQKEHMMILCTGRKEGSFKLQIARPGFPDLIRHKNNTRPRNVFNKSFSSILKERGYSDRILGEYKFENNTFVFTLLKENITAAAHIRNIFAAFSQKAHYVGTSFKAYNKVLKSSSGGNKRDALRKQLQKEEQELLINEEKRMKVEADKHNETLDENQLQSSKTIEMILNYTDQIYAYTQSEFSSENVLFLIAVHPRLARLRATFPELSAMMGKSGVERILWLHDQFVSHDSPRTVNLSSANSTMLINRVAKHRDYIAAVSSRNKAKFDTPPLSNSVSGEMKCALEDIQSLMKDTLSRFTPSFTSGT